MAIEPDFVTDRVLADVRNERIRQYNKLKEGMLWDCADPECPPYERVVILGEEFGEVCNAVLESERPYKFYEECLHVAAVAVAMAESVKRSC